VLARTAVAQDPESVAALSAIAFAQWQSVAYRSAEDPIASWNEGMEAAERGCAVAGSPVCHALKAALLAYWPHGGRWEEARLEALTAWRSNPNDSVVLSNAGFILAYSGDPAEGIRLIERALRINPRDPFLYGTFENMAQAHLAAERYAEGLHWARRATTAAPAFLPAYMVTAALYVGAGQVDKAREVMNAIRRLAPHAAVIRAKRSSGASPGQVDAGHEARQRYQKFLRIAAGLEESC
jgi:tetratricopeptide (TPR) repeat protein